MIALPSAVNLSVIASNSFWMTHPGSPASEWNTKTAKGMDAAAPASETDDRQDLAGAGPRLGFDQPDDREEQAQRPDQDPEHDAGDSEGIAPLHRSYGGQLPNRWLCHLFLREREHHGR